MSGSAVNIASHLVEMAHLQPGADALLTDPRRDSTGRLSYTRSTFKHLNDLTDALARGLASLGVAAGDRAALCLRPGVDFFAVTFALFKLGAIPVLIDPGIGLKNFGRCLAQAEPSAFIGIPLAHLLRRLFGWAKKSIRIKITTQSFGGRALREVESLGRSRSAADYPPTPPAAAILFTSGSTGLAKGVLYTHENFNAQIHALKQTYNIRPGEIDLATFPLFALFGPALGMTTVIPDMNFTRPGFVNPRDIIDPIQQLQITNMFGSPALIDRVSRYGEQHNVRLPSLKRVISAGAPASPPVLERFATMLGPEAEIFTPYGATEALPVSSMGSREILAETRNLTDQGGGVCVGRIVENIRARIMRITDAPVPRWSDDLELPIGEIGEIIVQGPAVTAEYFRRPDATALAKIQDSGGSFYHRMGDVGYLDPQGRLWFCGRKSQRVRLPGRELFSTPVEAIFNTQPEVARSALVGVKRSGSIEPVICIELKKACGSKSRRQLTEELTALAQRHDHTRMVKRFLFHPCFPVDIRHNAKINREQLAAWSQRKLK